MLYDSEKIDLWDPITGEELEDTITEKEKEEIDSLISDGKSLEALKDSHGWQLIEEFLVGCVREYKDKLVLSEDLEKIQRLQSTIRAYCNVLIFVEGKINEGRSFNNPRTPRNEG